MVVALAPVTVAWVALILASAADVLTTRSALRTGKAYEANPLMRWSTKTTRRALSTKAIGIGIAGWQLRAVDTPAALTMVWVAAILTAMLACHNFRLLRVLTVSSCVPVPVVADSLVAEPPPAKPGV